jgi:outer membrane protein TolC
MNKKLITYVLVLFSCVKLFSQEFTLKDCLDYAKQNNSNIRISLFDSEISDKVVKEQIGTALPQIDITGTVTDNLKVSTSLLPGILFGQPGTMIPVKMGVKYNSVATAKLTQKVFDPSFWVALKAANISDELSKQNLQKTDEQTTYDVSAAYYKAIILRMQLANLSAILKASEKTLASVELKFNNGIVKKVDVDKIKISYNNTKSQVEQAELNYRQALNLLKYQIGMPVEKDITPGGTLPEVESYFRNRNKESLNLSDRIDYQILQTNVRLYEADKENKIASYLPTLSFNANFAYTAMRNDFDFFKSKPWFNSSSIGLELKIPVFSGFSRYSRVEQAGLNLDIAREKLKLSEQAIKVEVSNYDIQYTNALTNIKNEKENLELAESVYNNMQLEYSQGTGSSLELTQAESSLRETQNNYYTRLLTLYIARLDLEKSKGTLNNFITNLK